MIKINYEGDYRDPHGGRVCDWSAWAAEMLSYKVLTQETRLLVANSLPTTAACLNHNQYKSINTAIAQLQPPAELYDRAPEQRFALA